MSTGDRWSQVDAVLEQALDREPEERQRFLVLEWDTELRRRLRSP